MKRRERAAMRGILKRHERRRGRGNRIAAHDHGGAVRNDLTRKARRLACGDRLQHRRNQRDQQARIIDEGREIGFRVGRRRDALDSGKAKKIAIGNRGRLSAARLALRRALLNRRLAGEATAEVVSDTGRAARCRPELTGGRSAHQRVHREFAGANCRDQCLVGKTNEMRPLGIADIPRPHVVLRCLEAPRIEAAAAAAALSRGRLNQCAIRAKNASGRLGAGRRC